MERKTTTQTQRGKSYEQVNRSLLSFLWLTTTSLKACSPSCFSLYPTRTREAHLLQGRARFVPRCSCFILVFLFFAPETADSTSTEDDEDMGAGFCNLMRE
jgi:hypothetical protein